MGDENNSGRVFIGGYRGSGIDEQDLHERFDQYGPIEEITPMARGFCFIQYDNPRDAQNAVFAQSEDCIIKGKKLTVQLAKSPGNQKESEIPSQPPQSREWNSVVQPRLDPWGQTGDTSKDEQSYDWNNPPTRGEKRKSKYQNKNEEEYDNQNDSWREQEQYDKPKQRDREQKQFGKFSQQRDQEQKQFGKFSQQRDQEQKQYGKFSQQKSLQREQRMRARLFLAGYKNKGITVDDLQEHFQVYGPIQEITDLDRQYAFIQFESPDAAEAALQDRRNRRLKNARLTLEPSKDSSNPEPAALPGRLKRSKSPEQNRQQKRKMREGKDRAGGFGNFGSDRGDWEDRDSSWQNRSFNESKDVFEEKFADPIPGANPPPNHCEIIVLSPRLRVYAEFIEKKLKDFKMRVDLLFPHENAPIDIILGDLKTKGVFYGVVISSNNATRNTVEVCFLLKEVFALEVLPVKEAIDIIHQDFMMAKPSVKPALPASAPTVPGSASAFPGSAPAFPGSAPTLPVSAPALPNRASTLPEDIQMILNFIMASRDVSVAEYDKVLDFLLSQRDALARKFSVPLRAQSFGYSMKPDVDVGFPLASENKEASKQLELQTRIKDLLRSKSGMNTSGIESSLQRAMLDKLKARSLPSGDPAGPPFP